MPFVRALLTVFRASAPIPTTFIFGTFLLLFSASALGHSPLRADAWSRGLDAAPVASTRPVVALRMPPGGRARIPGGSFTMGSSPAEISQAIALCRTEILRSHCDEAALQFRAEAPAHEVILAPYEMDKTEVTVLAYSRCVAAGACASPAFSPGDPRFDRPDLPVTNVTWEDAGTFCEWNHARLPTEAEWEFAARGREDRQYPWGNIFNPHLCNHGAFAPDETDMSDGYVGLAPVGSLRDGATPLGILDMAGNVAEWVYDFYDVDANGFGYSPESQVSPKGPKTGAFHVVRGGSYLEGAAWVRAAARGVLTLQRSPSVGFRCAADAR